MAGQEVRRVPQKKGGGIARDVEGNEGPIGRR